MWHIPKPTGWNNIWTWINAEMSTLHFHISGTHSIPQQFICKPNPHISVIWSEIGKKKHFWTLAFPPNHQNTLENMETKGIVQVCGIISGLSIERVSFPNGKRMACNSFINTKKHNKAIWHGFHGQFPPALFCNPIVRGNSNLSSKHLIW